MSEQLTLGVGWFSSSCNNKAYGQSNAASRAEEASFLWQGVYSQETPPVPSSLALLFLALRNLWCCWESATGLIVISFEVLQLSVWALQLREDREMIAHFPSVSPF